MLNPIPTRIFGHSLNWLARLVTSILAVLVVLIASAIIVLRYWLLPSIEQYHEKIATTLSAEIGSPVTIGSIEGGWQRLQPHLNFVDVRILDEQRQPVLLLPRIVTSISWMSIFTAELRLASLEIDSPELLIRRDAQGKLFVGGVALLKQGGDSGLADWLLHQPRMVVRNALIVWVDELRNAPTLVLQKVDLRVESMFNRHRFALRALPPEELSTPLDVRGDFRGTSFADLQSWRGQIYTQLDYTDVSAWRPWLELPGEFSRGRGALRGWLDIAGGKVTGVTADVALYDVVTKLAEDLPAMQLIDLRGRAAWHEVPGGMEISTRQLAMSMQNGLELPATDFYFLTAKNPAKTLPKTLPRILPEILPEILTEIPTETTDRQSASGAIRANHLQLDSLVRLAEFLPLETAMRARLNAYAPSGKISNLSAQWQGTAERPDSYKIKGHFENISVKQVGKMPGFSGVTVDVDGNETSGRLSINSRKLTLDAPGVMREPLFFATLTGQAGWHREDSELWINVDNVAVANEDLAGNVYGTYQTRSGTLGMLDLTARLTRGEIKRAARYTPLIALHGPASDWLNSALLAGHTEDFRIRIKANLSDFPLHPNTLASPDVLFQIGGHAQDVVVEFDKNWPRIENISGDFLINGNKLEVKSPAATMAGTRLQNISVTLPDMMSKDLALEIKGAATGASNVFLQFIQNSPVRGYINGFTDGVSASGNAKLDLFLRIPLLGTSESAASEMRAQIDSSAEFVGPIEPRHKPVQVTGAIHIQDNDINLGRGVPVLRNTRGIFSFTESSMKASAVQAQVLGGKAIINMQSSAGGDMQVSVQGQSNLDVMRHTDPHPLLQYLQGSTPWGAEISVVKKSVQVNIHSDLKGIRSTLPQPFTKRASEVMPLLVDIKPVVINPLVSNPLGKGYAAEHQDAITARLGKLLNLQLLRYEESGAMVIKRGEINFGDPEHPQNSKKLASAKTRKPRAGVWLTGSLPELSLQGWEGLAGQGSTGNSEKPGAKIPATPTSTMPIGGATLFIESLTGYGQSFKAVRINASRRGNGLAARLSSSMLSGELVWQPKSAATNLASGYVNNGKLSVNLRNLKWQKSNDQKNDQAKVNLPQNLPAASGAKTAKSMSPSMLPALEIAIENLQIKDRQIGRFELVGHPEGKDWRMRRLLITNPDGTLMGDGVWQGSGQSQVNLVLDISNAGKMLERSNYPNTVKGGSGRMEANLSWTGTPDEFNYVTLNGTLKLDTGRGQFLKMEPGIGKLLGILSLQSLPKRIKLDFNDVFSDGFQFDRIKGTASIKNGLLDTQDFHMDGLSAKVTMKGNVNLNDETQNLRVRVLPAIGDSVSLGVAFAAGPAVGVGALILNRVFGDPLDKLVSFEYNVSGTWADPSVVKVERVPPRSNM